jgi:drug/metabolite transporter (DMT)-like permease
VWARFFFGALFTLPFAMQAAGKRALRPVNPAFNSLRALFLILGTACFFTALKFLPIADTLAIYFVQPLIITALSPVVLKENVGLRRWITVCVGFLGVLIIIRPGLQAFNWGVVFALASGTCSACYFLITRLLAGSAPAMVTTFQTSAIGALPLSAMMIWEWHNANAHMWLLMILLGAIAITGHALITRAYDFAEASLLSPFNYSEMLMAVAAGWYFFGDFPDAYTFLGVAILIACAIYISWRERVRAREKLSAP